MKRISERKYYILKKKLEEKIYRILEKEKMKTNWTPKSESWEKREYLNEKKKIISITKLHILKWVKQMLRQCISNAFDILNVQIC